uniref:Uncharacterized protein LOC113796881 n=1 Tax=Dermatophagoides pteronyssinus TaxID=6956 RepID=A0A6P6YCA5_DERPT|nr:uncharacterized protein LOC113796881 [Dermatophagoides pteronyssinus]
MDSEMNKKKSAISTPISYGRIIYSDNNDGGGGNNEYHLERDIDHYFNDKDKRILFRHNKGGDSNVVGGDNGQDDDQDDDDDDDDLIKLIDNRKQVVNIIEIKRPPKNIRPPETIIYKGKRFRLFRPSNHLLQRARKSHILPAESIVEDDSHDHNYHHPHHHGHHGHRHHYQEIPINRSNRNKVRIGRKAYSNVGQLTEYPPPLSPPPLLPPIKRGQPMIAKVYWRRTIYPISPSSTTTNRPKRKTIYETITTASTNDDDQQRQKNPDKNTEKYIVVYVRKNSNNSIKTNNNVMTMDEPFIASSDNIPQKINIVKKHKNIDDNDNNGKKYRSKIPFNELFQSDDEDIVDNDGDGDSWPSDPYDDDDDNDIDDDDDGRRAMLPIVSILLWWKNPKQIRLRQF